jgi:hypothetical protein
MTASEKKDRIWAEIRQIVLDEGPASEEIDVNMAETGINPDCREALISQLIANRCAEIAALSTGPFKGMPLPLVLAAWTDFVMTVMQEQMEQANEDNEDEEVDD